MTFLRLTSLKVNSKSSEVLAAKRKNLVRQGKGNCPNATREVTAAEEDALFENGQFGVQDMKSLQRALWCFPSTGGLEMKAVHCAGEM